MPSASSAAASTDGSVDAVLQHGVHGGAEQAGLLDVGVASRIAIASTGCDAWISTIGRSANTCFSSVAVPKRRELAGLDDRDAMAVLRLVQVVRRDQHRHALPRQVADQIPEPPARQRIDAAGRLVEKHDRRLVEDGAAEREPLAPAAGQIARQRVLAALSARPSRARTCAAPRSARAARP